MPTPERIVLSGFSYEIYVADNGIAWIEFTDAERGIALEAWFPAEGWEAFKRDAGAAKHGIITASPDELRRLGI
jgi:hypothetical protein